MAASRTIVAPDRVASAILFVRGQRVLLDADLAAMYGVDTKTLNRAVVRNLRRFPEDFMFRLTSAEYERVKSQADAPDGRRGGRRYLPRAFTEQGVAMLSGVLNSPRAIAVNIEVMRAFVRLRNFIASNDQLARKLRSLERKYDSQFKVVFDAIRALMEPVEEEEAEKPPIGFRAD